MAKRANGSKKKLKGSVWIVIAVLLVGGVAAWMTFGGQEAIDFWKEDKQEEKENETPVKKVSIVNTDSKSRPYAVMINNHSSHRKYQSGLQDAFIVYEMIVEGGISRMMAVFQNKDNARVGGARSARHYYLDYALENDAIYVHWGQSPKSQTDINNGINGTKVDTISTNNSSKPFYRDNSLSVATEHKAFVSLAAIKTEVENKKLRTTMNNDYLLNYVVEEIDLSTNENAVSATSVRINYSSSYNSSYVYDEVGKVYKRSVNGSEHIDYVTKKQYTVKNIITYKVKNVSLNDGENKGRQDLKNIGEGTGYYITNGYAIPIKWSKSARDKQTKYMYLDGKEIDVNDGNTFIQIQPEDQTLSIS